MNGIKVKLFKESIDTCEINSCENSYGNIVWMHYDSIVIEEKQEFKDFFLELDQEKHSGDVQTMQLYLIKDSSLLKNVPNISLSKKNNNDCIFYIPNDDGRKVIYNFACFITFKLNANSIKIEEVYDGYKSSFRKKILFYIKETMEEIKETDIAYDWYGTLGSEELVLLVNANKIHIFPAILEKIRLSKKVKKYLKSTYSFIFSNKKIIEDDKELIKDMGASISLTLNPSGNVKEYLGHIIDTIYESLVKEGSINKLDDSELTIEKKKEAIEQKNIRFYNMIGKYDYTLMVPCNEWNFLTQFNEGGIFNSKNKLYCKNVFQIKTNWLSKVKLLSDNEDENHSGAEENNIDNNQSYIDEINYISAKMKIFYPDPKESDLLPRIVNVPHINQAIKLLYYDFNKNINSIFSEEWKEDLCYQFKEFLEIVCDPEAKLDELFGIIEEAINSIRQTYVHITQAGRLFFEIPSTNVRYTGSYSKILRAYYGIVKQLLYIAYSIPKKSEQSLLIPVITFEYTPKVKTYIYTQNKHLGNDRLVVFHLPYEALTDIPKYTKYLCHEVFHYIAPKDRGFRNKKLLEINLFFYFQNVIFYCMLEYTEQKLPGLEVEVREEVVKNYIIKNQKLIEEFVTNQVLENLKLSNQENEIDDLYDGQSLKRFMKTIFYNFFENHQGKHILNEAEQELLEKWFKEARSFSSEELMVLEKQKSQNPMYTFFGNDSIYNLFEWNQTNQAVIKKIQNQIIIVEFENQFKLGYQNIIYGFKEAGCDYFLIQILDLKLQDYIILIYDFLRDNGIIVEQEGIVNNSSLWCRLGIILHMYQVNMGITLEELDEIIEKDQILNEKISDEFLKFIRSSFQQYNKIYGRFQEDILELLNQNAIKDSISTKYRDLKGEINVIKSFCMADKKLPNDKFRINIKMMEYYQNQIQIGKLQKRKKDSVISQREVGEEQIQKRDSIDNSFKEIRVDNIKDYIGYVNAINEYLSPKGSRRNKRNLLWYRGQPDSKHILLPGLFRFWKKDRDISPLEYQTALLDTFCSRSVSNLETDILKITSSFDWLTQMQHYGMPTNLLDWSENAFVALFFALVKKDDTVTDKNAAVYILNPEYMELARQMMIKNIEFEKLKRHGYPIQNLSVSYDDKDNSDFLPYNKYSDLIEKTQCWYYNDSENYTNWWPKPIMSSLSNLRIRAQFGAFTISNLMAKPNFDFNEYGYDYLSIENMQKEFLSKYPDQNPFFTKIIIDNSGAKKIVEDLKCAGYKTMNVYPELENISEAIKQQMNSYFNFS